MVYQLLHVYAKNYEGNGQTLLIRMIRYSLDGMSARLKTDCRLNSRTSFAGLMLSQVHCRHDIFLNAYTELRAFRSSSSRTWS